MQATNSNSFSAGPSQAHYPGLRANLLQVIGSVAIVMTMLLQSPQVASPLHGNLSQALPSTSAPPRSQFFAATGRSVQGDFLGTLERFGVERVGYPLSEERQENGSTVQYFERVRMERHPELSSRGYSVLMTRLGADLVGSHYARVAPSKSTNTRLYFTQTGHSLSGAFLSYWKGNGGVELFGYPLSEPLNQNGLTVQWFERARMEYHPELANTGKAVQLGLLGKMSYEKVGAPAAKGAAQRVAPAIAPQQVAQAPAQAPAQPQITMSAAESYMLKEINTQRAAAGAQPVQVDSTITELSKARSNDMAERNYFSHTTPEGKNFLPMMTERKIGYKFAGEILARNNYPDNEASKVALESYLGSSAHKAIMLDGRFNLVGISYAKSSEDGMQYYTVIFVQR